MANYYSTTVSTAFEVDNKELVKDALYLIGFDVDENTDGTLVFGSYNLQFSDDCLILVFKDDKLIFGGFDSDDNAPDLSDESLVVMELGAFLQSHLVSDHILITEAGSEKLRAVVGTCCLLTKDDVKYFNCTREAEKYLVREKRINDIITHWVRENFGESEVDDPSWNIELLAKFIHENL